MGQGEFNCGASFQADFILNYFHSKFLNFPKISSQILNFLPAQLAGWNYQNHPDTSLYNYCKIQQFYSSYQPRISYFHLNKGW